MYFWRFCLCIFPFLFLITATVWIDTNLRKRSLTLFCLLQSHQQTSCSKLCQYLALSALFQLCSRLLSVVLNLRFSDDSLCWMPPLLLWALCYWLYLLSGAWYFAGFYRVDWLKDSVSMPLCCEACSVVSDCLRPRGRQPARLLCPWDFPGTDIAVSNHALLQGIFPDQGLNQRLLHCQADSLRLCHLGSPNLR